MRLFKERTGESLGFDGWVGVRIGELIVKRIE